MARERGQATVELLGVLPALLLLGLVSWQLILVGHSAWLSAHAARVAARADLVGDDAKAAARSVVHRADVDAHDGVARVDAAVPLVHPSWGGPANITARASLEAIP